MPTLNIRLSAEDAAIVKRLKREGVNLSKIARTAIREAAAIHKKPRKSALKMIADLDARFPIPPDAAPIGVDTTDRHAVSRYIRDRVAQKLGRKNDDLAGHQRPRRNRRSA